MVDGAAYLRFVQFLINHFSEGFVYYRIKVHRVDVVVLSLVGDVLYGIAYSYKRSTQYSYSMFCTRTTHYTVYLQYLLAATVSIRTVGES